MKRDYERTYPVATVQEARQVLAGVKRQKLQDFTSKVTNEQQRQTEKLQAKQQRHHKASTQQEKSTLQASAQAAGQPFGVQKPRRRRVAKRNNDGGGQEHQSLHAPPAPPSPPPQAAAGAGAGAPPPPPPPATASAGPGMPTAADLLHQALLSSPVPGKQGQSFLQHPLLATKGPLLHNCSTQHPSVQDGPDISQHQPPRFDPDPLADAAADEGSAWEQEASAYQDGRRHGDTGESPSPPGQTSKPQHIRQDGPRMVHRVPPGITALMAMSGAPVKQRSRKCSDKLPVTSTAGPGLGAVSAPAMARAAARAAAAGLSLRLRAPQCSLFALPGPDRPNLLPQLQAAKQAQRLAAEQLAVNQCPPAAAAAADSSCPTRQSPATAGAAAAASKASSSDALGTPQTTTASQLQAPHSSTHQSQPLAPRPGIDLQPTAGDGQLSRCLSADTQCTYATAAESFQTAPLMPAQGQTAAAAAGYKPPQLAPVSAQQAGPKIRLEMMQTYSEDLQPKDQLVLESQLGVGSTRAVYKASVEPSGAAHGDSGSSSHFVVVKLFKKHSTSSSEAAAGLDPAGYENERFALKLLRGFPLFVQLLGEGCWRGRRFLVLELAEMSLADMMCCTGHGLGADLNRELARFLLETLVVLASDLPQGVAMLHGDLKCDNILVTAGGHFLLADFTAAAVSKRVRPQQVQEFQGCHGTPFYMAPELMSHCMISRNAGKAHAAASTAAQAAAKTANSMKKAADKAAKRARQLVVQQAKEATDLAPKPTPTTRAGAGALSAGGADACMTGAGCSRAGSGGGMVRWYSSAAAAAANVLAGKVSAVLRGAPAALPYAGAQPLQQQAPNTTSSALEEAKAAASAAQAAAAAGAAEAEATEAARKAAKAARKAGKAAGKAAAAAKEAEARAKASAEEASKAAAAANEAASPPTNTMSTDVYSIGVVMVEALTGGELWSEDPPDIPPGGYEHALLFQEEMQQFVSGASDAELTISELWRRPEVLAARAFIRCCCQSDPLQRWTAEALLQHEWLQTAAD